MRLLAFLGVCVAGLAFGQPSQNMDGAQLLQSGARQWSGGTLTGGDSQSLTQAGYSSDGHTMINGASHLLRVEPLGVELAPLLLLSPGSGESWELGSTQTISWTSIGAVGDVKIRLYKGGVFQRFLGPAVVNTGSWDWTVPTNLAPGNDYRLVMHSLDYQYLDANPATFSLVAGPLSLQAPNGGEAWALGDTETVSWSADPVTGSEVKLRLAQNGALGTFLGPAKDNTGSWNWTLPPQLAPGTYRMFLYTPGYGYTDFSDEAFTIEPGPLEITAPNSALTWTRGTTQTVTWNAAPATGAQVKFKLYKDGVLDRQLGPVQANDGSWDWSIPVDLAAGEGYRLLIYTPDYQYLDMSDVAFALD